MRKKGDTLGKNLVIQKEQALAHETPSARMINLDATNKKRAAEVRRSWPPGRRPRPRAARSWLIAGCVVHEDERFQAVSSAKRIPIKNHDASRGGGG